ncbi:protein translocase subunit SecF [Alphaproteobacteria bacterium]|nr:protein translocase subunit SecF [Alphaproteobacteria bacterium]
MYKLRLVPKETKIQFMRFHKYGLFISICLAFLSFVGYFSIGLNTGIDFRGGTLFEVRVPVEKSNLSNIRSAFLETNLGEISIQSFGKPEDILIRVQKQKQDSDLTEQSIIKEIKSILRNKVSNNVEFRRVETVGPVVSGELKRKGFIALSLALFAMLIYIWFRFEWQFSIGAIVALIHDVSLTIGFLVITKLEFNLATIAAILTIIGYSMNDTVVVYDRIRENLRKYKKMALLDLLNLSVNNTLSRTTMTSLTTILALSALAIFGGANILGFTLVMIWGVLIGTYSSIFIAGPLLIYFGVKRNAEVNK